MNMFNLNGKTAVVLGAGVIGSAIARGFVHAGADLVLGYRSTQVDSLVSEFREMGVKVKSYQVEATDHQSVTAYRDQILKDFGSVDILVVTAGGNVKAAMTSDETSFFDLPMDALEKVVKTNLFGGAIIPAQVFGSSMMDNQEGGSIITISSMNIYRPLEGRPGYAAAKSALTNFTQWLSVYLAKECNPFLRVNSIAPGFFINSRMRNQLLDENGEYNARGKAIVDHTPMGRFGEPEEIVGTAVWLASEASKFVTGTVIPVDGGFNAYAGL